MSIVKDIRGIGHGVQCLRHFIMKIGCSPYVMELNPLLKNVTESNIKAISKVFNQPLTKWRKKRDQFGNYIPNFKDRIYPVISAAMAREKIYKADNITCQRCRRCLLK